MNFSNLFSRLVSILRSIPGIFHRPLITDVDRLPGELIAKSLAKSLSPEEEAYIQDQLLGKPTKEIAQRGSRGRWNPVLQEFVARHHVLLEYVKDNYGFRKGMVVATGRNQIGFSMVSKKDILWRRIDPMNLPVIQKFRREGRPLETVISSRPYCLCIEDNLGVGIPIFDKNYGLLVALGRALTCHAGELLDIEQLHLPMDKELREAVGRMLVRARKYFK